MWEGSSGAEVVMEDSVSISWQKEGEGDVKA